MESSVPHTVKSIMITFLVLDTIAISLRTYSRVTISKSFGYDDWATQVAYAGFVLLCGFAFKSIGEGYATPTMTLQAAKYFVICQLTYMVTMITGKVAAALVIYRLASNEKTIRRIIEVSTTMFLIGMVAQVFIIGFQCRPLAAAWGETQGECISARTLTTVGYVFSSMDIAISWLHAFLPAYMIWHVQISPRTKVLVVILLGLGVVSNIATIIRLKYLVELSTAPSSSALEQASQYLNTFIYSITEVGLTLFASSMVAIRPLLKAAFTFINWSTHGSRGVAGDRSGAVGGASTGRGAGASHGDSSRRGIGHSHSKSGLDGAHGIHLDEMTLSDSQENILQQDKGGIQSQVKYEADGSV